MSFEVGDKVFVCCKEPRIDNKETYIKLVGRVVDAFNACDDDGDHWRYKIKNDSGRFVQFYDDFDDGEITLIEKKDGTSDNITLPASWPSSRFSRS